MTGNNFLQIDPNAHFNASARHYDDLPENFLETVSPHNSGQTLSLQGQDGNGAHLAALNNMSVSVSDDFSYSNMTSMAASVGIPSYSSSLKAETLDHLLTPRSSHLNIDKYTYGGSASLLSPLQLDNRNDHPSLLGISRPNGRASEMLSSLRTNPTTYVSIKEELSSDLDYNADFETTSYLLQPQPSQQELERMTAATPPAISGDLMGPISGNDPFQIVQFEVATSQPYHPMSQPPPGPPTSSRKRARTKQNVQQQMQGAGPSGNVDGQVQDNLVSVIGAPGPVYSTTDVTDPLNAEIDDDIYIDTRDLCKRIAYELKQHSIPQAIFAERILCRSQGTLSDLLRNPKPWNKLKSGRETFRRMFNWVQQPLHVRLSILDMYKEGLVPKQEVPINISVVPVLTPPTPAQNARQHSRSRPSIDENGSSSAKRPRLVFTDIQKRTLQAIFKETQRPSREMQQTIAEHLRLDISTVSNFFMNARRRSRNGSVVEDEPAPYQQIRPISPPPESPTQIKPRPRIKTSPESQIHSMPEHIDEAVAAVAHGTATGLHDLVADSLSVHSDEHTLCV